eukprot:scaffold31218_cov130-Amphora_coffeaeformis.AAC.1
MDRYYCVCLGLGCARFPRDFRPQSPCRMVCINTTLTEYRCGEGCSQRGGKSQVGDLVEPIGGTN